MRRFWLAVCGVLGALVLSAAACESARPASQAWTDFTVETVVSGLEAPWDLAFLPDGRALVTERPGRIRIIQGGRLLSEAITVPNVAARGEGGLLGLAADPAFDQNQRLYVYHTYEAGDRLLNRVVRFTLSGASLEDSNVIVDGIPGSSVHNGGRVAFGPDGRLYVGTGDGSQPDVAQDRSSLGGKVLRLNADGSVPSDNPFPGSSVYAYGLRNVQGLAWQPGSDQLYVVDHGPVNHDEVNRIEPGGNHGWPQMRGNEGTGDGFISPVAESGGATWAPSGATFLRDGALPQWRDGLLFAGLRSQTLWFLDLSAGNRVTSVIEQEYGRLRQVVQGPDGLIYLLTSNRDGRGSPAPDDDRILRLRPQ